MPGGYTRDELVGRLVRAGELEVNIASSQAATRAVAAAAVKSIPATVPLRPDAAWHIVPMYLLDISGR